MLGNVGGMFSAVLDNIEMCMSKPQDGRNHYLSHQDGCSHYMLHQSSG